jgi:hypothetical protein
MRRVESDALPGFAEITFGNQYTFLSAHDPLLKLLAMW